MRNLLFIVILAVIISSCTIPGKYKVEDYCKNDSDCVRQGSCCDCGLGQYVNTYHFVRNNCHEVCKCMSIPSKGVCENNKCTPKPITAQAKDYCESDDNCVCGGIDLETRKCFIGNKEYYNKYVNKTADCPDFCTGIAGNLNVKCVEGKCKLIQKNINVELQKHWKCTNGLFVDEPERCYDNSCKANADCILKETEGICGKQNISLPRNAFPAVFVPKKCVGEQCNVVEPSCMPPDKREQIIGAICKDEGCTTLLQKTEADGECTNDEDCEVTGCSGQLCMPKEKAKDTFTTCEWASYYECYKMTKCDCVNRKCNWADNSEFTACMTKNKK